MKRLVVFSQPNCNPCKMLKNHLDRIGIEYSDIDSMSNPEEASKYEVMSAPVTILMDGEEPLDRSFGFNPPELEAMITQL